MGIVQCCSKKKNATKKWPSWRITPVQQIMAKTSYIVSLKRHKDTIKRDLLDGMQKLSDDRRHYSATFLMILSYLDTQTL